MGEEIGIEGKYGDGEDGGDGAGDAPGPPADQDSGHDGERDHAAALGPQQRVGVHAGRVIEGLNCDWGAEIGVDQQRFPLRRLGVDLKKISRQADSEKLTEERGVFTVEAIIM